MATLTHEPHQRPGRRRRSARAPAYRSIFANLKDFDLCAEARDGFQAVDAYAAHLPQLVLMDLQMPNQSGVEATREICERWPDACIVVLTTFDTNEFVVSALQAGAAGYLLKDLGGRQLLAAMHQALAGEMPLSGAVRRELVSSVVANRTPPTAGDDAGQPRLTARETEVLEWLAQGLTNQQIGTQMHVSEGSVKQYLSHIGDKIGVKSRTGILIRAIQLDLVDPRSLPPVVG